MLKQTISHYINIKNRGVFVLTKKIHIFIFVTFIFIVSLYSAAGENALAFLKIGIGPSASALGDAFTVLSKGAESSYWNPAGIVSSRKNEIYLYQNFWIEDISQQYVSAVFYRPDNDLSIALSAMYLNTGDMPYREILGDQPVIDNLRYSDYSGKDLAITFSFSKMFDDFSAGINLKVIEEKIHTYSATVIAADFGLNYYDVRDNLNFSVVVLNFGSRAKFVQESFDIPLTVKIGGTYSNLVFNKDYDLAVDIVKTLNENIGYRIGGQIHLPYQIILRTGYNSSYDIGKKINLGFGKKFGAIDFNYSWSPSSLVDDAHKFSLGYTW
jgi:hypothetical protein